MSLTLSPRRTRFLSLPLVLVGLFTAGCDDGRLVQTVERDFEIGEANTLVHGDGARDLRVIGEPGRDHITLVGQLRTRRPSRADDGRARKAVRLDYLPLRDDAGRFTAGLHEGPAGYHLDLVAIVPESVALEIDDGRGDILIEGVGSLVLADGDGDVMIEDVAGAVEIDDGSGDIMVRNVGGDVSIEDKRGDMAILDVGGDVQLRDGAGDIAVTDVVGAAVVQDGAGDIALIRCGDAEVRSDTTGDVAVL